MGNFSNAGGVASPKKQKSVPNTINAGGGEAYKLSDQLQLIALLASSFCQAQYYTSANEQVEKIVELGKVVDPLFCAKLAIYARDTMNMRSATHVLAATVGARAKGETWTKEFFNKVVVRPDDMIEIMAFFKSRFSKTVPHAMKKGFAKAFARFDDYQLRKYRGNGALTLVDVVRLCHPKGVDGSSIKKLVYDKLPVAETWETKVSGAGKDEDAKSEAFGSLIREKKMGYFALLRNLRNILNTCDEETITLAQNQLMDPERIKKSRLLPFRFYSAYKELAKENGSRAMLTAISTACDFSLSNMSAQFKGSTLVAVDTSGSMGSAVGRSGNMSCMEAGLLFGVAVYKAIPNSDLMIWASGAAMTNMPDNIPMIPMVETLNQRANGEVGHGTNVDAIFQGANKKYDRIVIMSDMQSYLNDRDHGLNVYKLKNKADPWIHWFNLAGSGDTALPWDGKKVSFIPGFSEKVLDILAYVEQDPQAMVNEIEKIEL